MSDKTIYTFKPRGVTEKTTTSASAPQPPRYSPTPPHVPPSTTRPQPTQPPPGYAYQHASAQQSTDSARYTDEYLGTGKGVSSLVEGIRKATGYKPKKKQRKQYVSSEDEEEEKKEKSEEEEESSEEDESEEEKPKLGKHKLSSARMRGARLTFEDINNRFNTETPATLLASFQEPYADPLTPQESNELVQYQQRQQQYLEKVEDDPHFQFFSDVAFHCKRSNNIASLIQVPGSDSSSSLALRFNGNSGGSAVVRGLTLGESIPANPNPGNWQNDPVEIAAGVGDNRTIYDLLRSGVDRGAAQDHIRRQRLLNNVHLLSRPEVVGVMKIMPDGRGGMRAAQRMLEGYCMWLPRNLNFDHFILNPIIKGDMAELVGLKILMPGTVAGGTPRLQQDVQQVEIRLEMLCLKMNKEYTWDKERLAIVYKEARDSEESMYGSAGVSNVYGSTSQTPLRLLYPPT